MCLVVSCADGDEFIISLSGLRPAGDESTTNKNYRPWCFIDGTGVRLLTGTEPEYRNYSAIAPEGTAYFVANARISMADETIIAERVGKSYDEAISDIVDHIASIDDNVTAMEEDVDAIENTIGDVADKIQIEWDEIDSYPTRGAVGEEITFDDNIGACSHFVIYVTSGSVYDIYIRVAKPSRNYIDYYVRYTDADDVIVSNALINNTPVSDDKTYQMFRVTVPDGAVKMYVSSYIYIGNKDVRITRVYKTENKSVAQ